MNTYEVEIINDTGLNLGKIEISTEDILRVGDNLKVIQEAKK